MKEEELPRLEATRTLERMKGAAAAALCGLAVLTAPFAAAAAEQDAAAGTLQVFIGTSGNASILAFALDPTTGVLVRAGDGQPAASVHKHRSWQAVHPQLPVLYSADGGGSQVSAWQIGRSGMLSALGAAAGVAAGPNFVAPVLDDDTARTTVIASAYGAGAVVVIQTDKAGALQDSVVTINHTGHSKCPRPIPPKDRQQSPHPHGIFAHPLHPTHIFVPDLGLDQLFHYRLRRGVLSPFDAQPTVDAPPCSGPRHLTFSANSKWILLLHEIANTISVHSLDAESGMVGSHPLSSVSTLPDGWGYCDVTNMTASKCSKAAEIRLLPLASPAMSAVYASNRGHNSLLLLHLNEESGELATVAFSNGLVWPRAVAVLPDPRGVARGQRSGLVIAAACGGDCNRQDGSQPGELVVFEADAADGRLVEMSRLSVGDAQPISVVVVSIPSDEDDA